MCFYDYIPNNVWDIVIKTDVLKFTTGKLNFLPYISKFKMQDNRSTLSSVVWTMAVVYL